MSELMAVRLTQEEKKEVQAYALDHDMSASDVIRRALRVYLSSDYGKGYLSLKQLSEDRPEDMTLAFSQFLDDFGHAKDKAALIEEEPVWTKEEAGRWFFDFAATAHKLADDNGLPVPAWCLKDEYFSKEPFWAFDTKNEKYRAYLQQTTPKEFAWHGLFLGSDILKRF